MRVVSGRWRGRRLKAPKGEAVRPTTDRVKEALFNILGPAVGDALVLDLCCGAGGLGIEALSRGATRAVFVDAHRGSLAAAEANLGTCGAERGEYTLVRDDAVRWLKGWTPPSDGTPWVLLADPPYRTGIARAIMGGVDRLAGSAGFAGAVVEFGSRSEGPGAPWEVRTYGESALAVRRPGRAPETKG